MDPTLFSDLPEIDPEKDYEAELIGDGKKFKDVKALARGKAESDLMIERLKREQEALRADLAQKVTLDQVMDRLSKMTPADPAPQSRPTETEPNDQERQPLDETVLLERVSSILDQRDKTRQEQENLKNSRDLLIKTFGINYVPEVKKRAAELNLGENFLDDLAKTQPRAFAAILGLNGTQEPQGFTAPPPSKRVIPGSTQLRDFQYYEDLRKSDPRTFHTAATQNDMFKNFQELGEDVFYGRLKP